MAGIPLHWLENMTETTHIKTILDALPLSSSSDRDLWASLFSLLSFEFASLCANSAPLFDDKVTHSYYNSIISLPSFNWNVFHQDEKKDRNEEILQLPVVSFVQFEVLKPILEKYPWIGRCFERDDHKTKFWIQRIRNVHDQCCPTFKFRTSFVIKRTWVVEVKSLAKLVIVPET